MEKRFLIVTSPVNIDLVAHKDFIRGVRDTFDIKITKLNYHIISDIAFPAHRVHLFDGGEFLGSLAVVDEEGAKNARIRDSH